jgi:hypothetical protein
MIVFAVVGILIFTVIACVGLVCAHYDSDDLRKMGIRL